MLRPLAFLLPSLLLTTTLHAQDASWCLTHELTERHLAEQGLPTDLRRALPAPVAPKGGGDAPVIPVVVHVVWNVPAGNIPDAIIEAIVQQMDEDLNHLNADAANVRPAFAASVADAGIRLCLAQYDPQGNPTNGITRTQTTATWFNPNTQPHTMKAPPLGKSAWDPTKYLNIWVCDINSGSFGGIVNGYTYLPTGGMAGSPNDGLVIDHQHGMQMGTRTATHEAGHYFGLLHTFDGFNCFSDDGHSDTPNTDSPTWNCFNPNLMKCGVLTQYENFMDYSTCLSMFTHQQAAYMNGVLNGIRASLLTSTGCTGVGTGIGMSMDIGPLGVYPNPVADVLTVALPEGRGRLTIHDAMGRVVLERTLSAERSEVGLSGLSQGLYIAMAHTGSGTRTARIAVAGR